MSGQAAALLGIGWATLSVGALMVVALQVRRRCDCGVFWRNHPVHGMIVAAAWVVTSNLVVMLVTSVATTFAQVAVPIAWQAALPALLWWAAWRHGKGRRRWPRRLAGRVRVDADRRRLVVEP